MTVIFNDFEKKVKFSSEIKLIEWMRKHDPEPSRDLSDFMEGYKIRKLLFEQIHVRTDSPQEFVSDLIQYKIISVLK